MSVCAIVNFDTRTTDCLSTADLISIAPFLQSNIGASKYEIITNTERNYQFKCIALFSDAANIRLHIAEVAFFQSVKDNVQCRHVQREEPNVIKYEGPEDEILAKCSQEYNSPSVPDQTDPGF